MKKIMMGLMAVVALTAVSCTKEDQEEAQPVTTENVAGAYTVTHVEATVSGIKGDMTNQWFSDNMAGSCSKDDITTFRTTGVYEIDDAATVCDPSSNSTGTWSVQNGTLMMDGEAVTVDFFSGKTLKVSMAYSSGTGSGDKITFTYTRK